jgi:ribosomal protein S18 acetylase RimI-like enzyme
MIVISKYTSEHENDVIEAISKEPDWNMFTHEEALDNYKKSLKNSITYICYKNNKFCGYLRALLDDGFAIYISELYVIPKCRNQKVGQSLLERVKNDFSNLDIYTLSDEDAYYQKKGYKRIGSVFEL